MPVIYTTRPPEWKNGEMKKAPPSAPEATMGLKPRVLIADDNRKILTRVSDLLCSSFEVVAEVMDGRAALEAAAKFNPELAVLDIAIPELNGIRVARELRRLGLQAKVVFITLHRGDDYLTAAFESGALGFVYKSRLHPDLIPALHHALEGYRFVSPQGFLGQTAGTHVKTWFPRDRGFHTLQFYHDDQDRLAGGIDFVVAALKESATVIYVDSKPHLECLTRKLEVFGLRAAIERGHFIALDVHRDVLPYIMVGGMPDAAQITGLFDDTFRQTSSPSQNNRRLALAGEIAPVLWAEGLPDAALEVERLTDEFVHARSASVFCTYPVQSLCKTHHHQTMARLCALHTSVVPETN
jgi:CheY-like chemotaxis protein